MFAGRPASAAVLGGVLLGAAALGLAACGSEEGNPPPAEPAASPPPASRPAGNVLDLKGEAEGVAVDSKDGVAVVAFRDPDRLALIDVGAGSELGEVATPAPSRHLEMAGDGTTVLVPVEYEDELLRVDLGALPLTRPGAKHFRAPAPEGIATGDFPHDAVEAGDGTIFVGDEGGDTVSVIRGGRVTATLDAPEQPGGVAVSGDVLAVVSVAAREITFFDTGTLENLGTLDAGAGPSHVVAGEDGRFYVADTGGDAILVFDSTPAEGGEPRLVDRANVPGSPYGLALDPARDLLYVTQTARNRVLQLELTELAPRAVDSFPTVRQPNSVGVDARSGALVVAGRTGGEVQILDPAAAP